MQHVKWQWRGLALFASMVALVPRSTSAHVKWFEDPARHPLRTDLILSGRTAITVGASALAVALLYLLRRFVEDPHWPEVAFLKQMAIGAPTLLAVQASIGLVHAAVQPALLVPSLPLGRDALGQTLAALQFLIAFSLLT